MKILVTEPTGFSEEAQASLQAAGHTVVFFEGELPPSSDDLVGFDGIIVRLGVTWTASLLERCADLKLIATPTTGLTHIDVTAAERCGIEVLSLRGLPGLERITSTPEHALALLLALARNVVSACCSVQHGAWTRYAFTGTMLSGKHVGIVGLGRTGRAFARMVAAMDMVVHYFDPYVEASAYTRHTSLNEMTVQCDVMAVHAELNEETGGLLDRAFFQNCKSGALLVNTARGELLDESALLEALEAGRLGGAALDVVVSEPVTGQPWDSPLRDYCRQHSNLVITPHIAGATFESIPRAEEILAGAIVRRSA